MDAFTFAWATEELPPERHFKGGTPSLPALDVDAKFGAFTNKPKRQRGKKVAKAKREAKQ